MLALLPTFDDIHYILLHYGYVALMFMLLGAGMGVPIPEDIPLILAGYLTNPINAADGHSVPNLYLMMIAGMIGVLAGDSVVYFIGRKGIDSNNFVARHIRKVMTPKRLAWAEKHFAQHGNLTVFCGRFMPGFRAVVFAMAGVARMGYVRFVLVDGIAALISVPLFILMGHHLAGYLPLAEIPDRVEHTKHILIPIFLGVALIGGGILFFRRKRRKAAVAAADGPIVPLVADKAPAAPPPSPASSAADPVPETSAKE